MLKQLVRSAARKAGLTGSANSPTTPNAVWRRVEHGPLAGLEFLLPGPSGNSWADRIVNGTYEPDVLGAVAELASTNGVLYDIGAHIGFFASAWIKLGGRSAEAFEPLPSNAAVLRQAVTRNGMAQTVRVHACALGNANSQVRLLAHENGLGSSSMAFVEGVGGIQSQADSERYRSSKPTLVELRRLDDLVAAERLPPPDVLKIDVEGAEADTLAGAAELLARFKPVIVCEVHNIDSGLLVGDRLARLNYTMTIIGTQRLQVVARWQVG